MDHFKTIDDYIESQPEKVRYALHMLRSCIKEVAPDATELFNYNIPAFSLVPNGKRDHQIMIAGYKNHVGLYPHPTVIEKFIDELSDYKTGKGSVQFPLSRPIPEDLVIRMVRYRKDMILKKVKK